MGGDTALDKPKAQKHGAGEVGSRQCGSPGRSNPGPPHVGLGAPGEARQETVGSVLNIRLLAHRVHTL